MQINSVNLGPLKKNTAKIVLLSPLQGKGYSKWAVVLLGSPPDGQFFQQAPTICERINPHKTSCYSSEAPDSVTLSGSHDSAIISFTFFIYFDDQVPQDEVPGTTDTMWCYNETNML